MFLATLQYILITLPVGITYRYIVSYAGEELTTTLDDGVNNIPSSVNPNPSYADIHSVRWRCANINRQRIRIAGRNKPRNVSVSIRIDIIVGKRIASPVYL